MRVCLVYDCLFPYTVGGAERWYRNLAERLAAAGHEVTYLTLRQWPRDEPPELPGVRIVAVGPRIGLYARGGRRRILPPLLFGLGVLAHLARHGRRYDVVHTCSFPFFSLLAAAAVRPRASFRLVVDWFEVWTRDYWTGYLGRVGGTIGYAVQGLCRRVPHAAFCFSRLHAARLASGGHHGELTRLEGMYAGSVEPSEPAAPDPLVMFAGRHIPEKQVPALVPALVALRGRRPELDAVLFGDGPERARVGALIAEARAEDWIALPGFVEPALVESTLRRAGCMVLPSRREGYGMVVVEAASAGTPSVVVADPDNAATELIEEGVNGHVARSASAADLAEAIGRALDGGAHLRDSTRAWYAANARRLSMDSSLDRVVSAYAARPGPAGSRPGSPPRRRPN